jgi:hypothetical protein
MGRSLVILAVHCEEGVDEFFGIQLAVEGKHKSWLATKARRARRFEKEGRFVNRPYASSW